MLFGNRLCFTLAPDRSLWLCSRAKCTEVACRVHDEPVFTMIFSKLTVLLTTGAAGEAVRVIQVPHGLAGLAGSIHTLPTFDTDTC